MHGCGADDVGSPGEGGGGGGFTHATDWGLNGGHTLMQDVLVVLGKRGDSSVPLVQPALLPSWWVNAARLVMPF